MTLDEDYFCDESDDTGTCYPVWFYCDGCEGTLVGFDIDPAYIGGLVPAGEGMPIDKCKGNLWYDLRDLLRNRYDVCPQCTGSGGGYGCGKHDA
jgi:hypothetical protein